MVSLRYIFATVVIVFGSSFQFGFQTGVINSPLPVSCICTVLLLISRLKFSFDAFAKVEVAHLRRSSLKP